MNAREPSQGLISLIYIIYALHFFSALTGMLSSAFVVTAFLTGWPSVIAVILSYIKRGDAKDTWLESHFAWVIQTFWYAAGDALLAIILTLTIIGIVAAYVVAVITGIWVIYRIFKGVLSVLDQKPIDP